MKNISKKSGTKATKPAKQKLVENISEEVYLPASVDPIPEDSSMYHSTAEEPSQDMSKDPAPTATVIPAEFEPSNWDMQNDIMISTFDDILYYDKKLVVKDSGFKVGKEPVGESVLEDVLVKSTVRFGQVINAGRNSNYTKGDIVSFNGQNCKPIDFDKLYVVAPAFAIYGKINLPGRAEPTPTVENAGNRKNLFGRIMQRFNNWVGMRNVHKQK